MTERAEASELLNTQIVNSLTRRIARCRSGRSGADPEPRRTTDARVRATGEWPHYTKLPVAAAPLAGVIDECLTTGKAIVRRALEMPHAGDVTHVGVTVSPLGPDGNGGVICLFSDLTAVVQLEEQLRLKETLARLGELTAGIAHEFRNGLATIHGYGKLLDPASLPPQYRPYVEGIRQETVALGEVVTNFLNFARPTQLSLATHDLRAIVERGVDDLKSDVRQLNGNIVVAGEFGQVDADDVLLRQAFSNLLRNAVEACQGAGVTPDIRVEGALDAAQGVARVTVLDNGPGIPARRARQDLPSVLHDQEDGHGSRIGARPEDRRHSQRSRAGDEIACRWRVFPSDVAARLTLRSNIGIGESAIFSELRFAVSSSPTSDNSRRRHDLRGASCARPALAAPLRIPVSMNVDRRTDRRLTDRGSMLVEALVATLVLTTGLLTMAELVRVATATNVVAKNSTLAGILAEQKIEQLRALAWEFDVSGIPVSDASTDTTVLPESPSGGTGLQSSPGLRQNSVGFR